MNLVADSAGFPKMYVVASIQEICTSLYKTWHLRSRHTKVHDFAAFAIIIAFLQKVLS